MKAEVCAGAGPENRRQMVFLFRHKGKIHVAATVSVYWSLGKGLEVTSGRWALAPGNRKLEDSHQKHAVNCAGLCVLAGTILPGWPVLHWLLGLTFLKFHLAPVGAYLDCTTESTVSLSSSSSPPSPPNQQFSPLTLTSPHFPASWRTTLSVGSENVLSSEKVVERVFGSWHIYCLSAAFICHS